MDGLTFLVIPEQSLVMVWFDPLFIIQRESKRGEGRLCTRTFYIFYVDSLSTVVYVKHALHSYAPNTAYLTENTECQAFYPVIRTGSPTPSSARECCSFGSKGGDTLCTVLEQTGTKPKEWHVAAKPLDIY
jgi:hypothetical protein